MIVSCMHRKVRGLQQLLRPKRIMLHAAGHADSPARLQKFRAMQYWQAQCMRQSRAKTMSMPHAGQITSYQLNNITGPCQDRAQN